MTSKITQLLEKLADEYYNKKNYEETKECYEKSNTPIALFKLGKLYYNGKLGESDYIKAKEYFIEAKKHYENYQDNINNIKKLKILYYIIKKINKIQSKRKIEDNTSEIPNKKIKIEPY